MTFDRITTKHDFDDTQPRIRDLDVSVVDILDTLAEETSLEAVIAEYPELEAADIQEALQFVADMMRRVLVSSQRLPERQSYIASQIALNNPSIAQKYHLYDAEDEDKALADITAFQLEFLKSQMMEPSEADEGWYFSKEALAAMPLHIKAMHEAIDDTDEEAEELEEKIEGEDFPSATDQALLAKLVAKAELFEVKVEELENLFKTIKAALEDYDAFEITWKDIGS
jgi:uncharacterized protein (DUF433 family)